MNESKVHCPLNFSDAVYILDRDYSVSDSIRLLLGTEKISGRIFGNSESLLAHCLSEPPLCIVMDAVMDDIDTVQFLKTLENEMICVPVILLGENSKISNVVASIKGGAWDYLEKPLIQQRLLTSVQNAMEYSRSQL